MKNRHHSLRTLTMFSIASFATLLGVGASSAHAEQRQGALGANGELYTTEVGIYADLFPGTRAPAGVGPRSEVLALDIIAPGGAQRRVLVPNTDGNALESTPALLFEDRTKTLFAVWATRLSSLNSVLYLASFDGTGWSHPVRITGNPFASKLSPRLAVTRDAYFDTTVSPGVTHERTVLHLAWAEQDRSGLLEIYYTPLIFEDGNFLGFDPSTIQNLNGMDPGKPVSQAVPSDLVAALSLTNGRDGRTVLVAFASSTTGRLVTLEIDVLPREISLIADQVRAQIDAYGPQYYPAKMGELASLVANGIMAIGQDFHPEILQPIANRVRDLIQRGGGVPLQNLNDGVRAAIIDLGFKLSGRGLILANSAAPVLQAGPPAQSSAQIATTDTPATGASARSAAATASQSQWLQFRLDSNRPLPGLPISMPGSNILPAQNGQNAIIEWQQDATHLLYTRSQGDGWDDALMIELSDKLSFDQALSYLQQHLR